MVMELAGGVRIEWRGATQPDQSLNAASPGMPLVTIGGARLPARLVALRIAGSAPVAPQIEALTSQPWIGAPLAADQVVPQTISGEPRPGLAATLAPALPETPVVVLREGWMRGNHIAVLALSTIFSQDGAPRSVTDLRASIPRAAPLAESAADMLASESATPAAVAGPTNPAAGKGWKIDVARAGIQRLTAAALAAAGVPLRAPEKLHLRHAGVPVALEQRGGGASLELRFYAPPPGDRWNAGDTYWLTAETTPGLRMAARSGAPGTAALRSTARERGVWRHNTVYDSHLAGLDGDHWFAADLKTGPGQPAATLSVPLTPTLLLIAATTVLTLTGGAYTSGQHNLSVVLGGQTRGASWSGAGAWTQTLTFTVGGTNATIKLIPGGAPDGVEIDGVAWERSVGLDLGGQGAAFEGVAGEWRYQLKRLPAGRTLYDISDTDKPDVLSIAAGTDVTFQDGPAARRYLLAGPGTLWAPAISRSRPYDFATAARALYIVPSAFHAALAPLLAHRDGQGYNARAIDVQAIYDAWSYGQVAPEAIRAFLRYSAASWSTRPVAATLVGDGTSDPLNYTGRNNTNFIPPYLAMVDPWLGETACEACYARFDGPDPLLDRLQDLQLGRLPVKSAAELSTVVAKIIAYEASPLEVSWRSRNLYVADDADRAGDFAAFADASAREQPAGADIWQMYYDPHSVGISWREPSADRAYRRTLAALSQGAGLVNFIGHGSPFQWASTDLQATPPYLLGLYDVDALTNGARQPIVLEMTCLTSAFQTPAFSGTTIDERLVLKPDGGAIAVWGPTGQGVAHGHDWLQQGFYAALWDAPPSGATVGQLVAAGYLELYTSGSCCDDALATYALLGDPLTTARVVRARQVHVPVAGR
jgi:hypothetical protein